MLPIPLRIVAAIGSIESADGTFGDAARGVRLPIVGPPIDCPCGFATIVTPDSPDGWAYARVDMQFTTTTTTTTTKTTWPAWAALSDGPPFDPRPDVDNAWDAITTRYLRTSADEITNVRGPIGRYDLLSDPVTAALIDRAIEYLGDDCTDRQGNNAATADADVNRRVRLLRTVRAGRSHQIRDAERAGNCSEFPILGNDTPGVPPTVRP